MNTLLSVCIIAKNEEEMLPGCLESVKECAGEVILVDTGSADKTFETAKSFGCKVFNYPWQNDFSKARNFALEQASLPFVLSIDADERLVNSEELMLELEKAPENIGGWLIKVTSESSGKGAKDSYVSSLLRLFRNHPEIRFEGSIHEQILPAVTKLGYKILNTNIEIFHLGYARDAETMKKKQLRNLEMLNAALEQDPERGYNLYQRAKTHLALGDLESAEKDVQRALDVLSDDNASTPQLSNYGSVIAYRMGKHELSIHRAKKSLEIIPRQSFANFILGENYWDLKMYYEACKAYKKIETEGTSGDIISQVSGDYRLPEDQLYFKIGRSLVKLNKIEEAAEYFEKGLQINPNDVNNLTGAANTAFKKFDFENAKTLMERALSISPNNKQLKSYLSQVNKAIEAKNKTEALKKDSSLSQARIIKEKKLLSLSMIVKNEEKNLPGCLDSVKDIVDEIIIVDTGSEDRTKEIASEFRAEIFDYPWQNDFSAARNESLKRCKGEWVLYLDADERLEEKSKAFLRNMLENTSENIGGYICTIESRHAALTGEAEEHRGGYPRIFRNYGYPKIKFMGRVHEQITPSILELGKNFLMSDVVIKHLGYDQSREVMEQKIKRNYAMLMQHINEEPANAFAWYQLGQTLAQMNLKKEAEDAVRFSIQLGGLSDSVFASAAATMAQLTGAKRNFKEAIGWAEKSLQRAPEQLYALHLKAYALLYLNLPKEAEELFYEVKRRKQQSKSVPRSGFDIVIPDKAIEDGIRKARSAAEGKK